MASEKIQAPEDVGVKLAPLKDDTAMGSVPDLGCGLHRELSIRPQNESKTDDGNIHEDQSDNQTVYSDDGSIDGDILNVCKTELADSLANHILQLEVGQEGYANITRKLPPLLKAFALRIGIQAHRRCRGMLCSLCTSIASKLTSN